MSTTRTSSADTGAEPQPESEVVGHMYRPHSSAGGPGPHNPFPFPPVPQPPLTPFRYRLPVIA